MSTPPPALQALLENHLAFTEAHRGRVVRGAQAVRIESDLPGFGCLLPLLPAQAPELRPHLERAELVRLLPWSACTSVALERQGFRPQRTLVYMTLAAAAGASPAASPVRIAEVRDAQDMQQFTDVQTAAFLEGEPDDEVARWRGWLGRANAANLGAPEQTFFLGSIDGAPAGVLLLLRTGATAGLYAVATAPASRGRGVSTALLRHAVERATELGCTQISLQVLQGSYAERFYAARGFVPAFASPSFERGAAT